MLSPECGCLWFLNLIQLTRGPAATDHQSVAFQDRVGLSVTCSSVVCCVSSASVQWRAYFDPRPNSV